MRGELTQLPDGGKRLVVEFSGDDLVRVPLNGVDILQLSEPTTCLADVLLDAELIARKLHMLDAPKVRGDE